jgi:hypothetical protein
MPSRDVIMTTLHRVRSEYVADFLESLQRTDYRGDVVMFVSAMDDGELAKLRNRGVTVVPFRFRGRHIKQRLARLWPLWRWFFRSGAPRAARERLAEEVFHLFYLRHLLYLKFLRKQSPNYDRVFLTDARDVFFQANPFSWNLPDGVHLFLEDASNKLGREPSHVACIRNQFGQAVLDEIGKETISCAGTVLGDTASIMKYLAEMVALTMQAGNLRDVGGDQGIHNYLLYKKNRLPEIVLHDNGAGPVLTVGVMRPEAIRMNTQGQVVNDAGDLMPVLHQYDRFPQLQKTLLDHLHQPLSQKPPAP